MASGKDLLPFFFSFSQSRFSLHHHCSSLIVLGLNPPRIVQSIPCYDFPHPHISSFYITTAQLVGYISTSTLYPLPFTLHLLRTLHPTPPDYDYCNYYIGGFFSESYHSFTPPPSFSSPKRQSLLPELLIPYTIIFCNAFVQLFRLIPPVNVPFFAIIHFITSSNLNP